MYSVVRLNLVWPATLGIRHDTQHRFSTSAHYVASHSLIKQVCDHHAHQALPNEPQWSLVLSICLFKISKNYIL